MELLPEINEVFEKLNKYGFEANLVGECIREYLMGCKVHDINFCTNAKPKDIIKIFSRVIPIGIEYGIVHVLIDNNEFKIMTYRRDSAYEDGRDSENVSFISNLEDDLKRRDFTINAMAYNPNDGIIDKFCGRKDIENKVIRTVGIPDERFSEDAIRMLRGIRLATKMGFTIEENTLKSIIKNRELIKKVSKDRIRSELNGIFLSDNLIIGIEYLFDTKLYESIFEKLYDTYEKQYTIIKSRVNNLDLIELSDEEVLKVVLASFLCKHENIDYSIEFAYRYLKNYNYPNSISKDVLKIIKYIDMVPYSIQDVDDKLLKKQVSKLSGTYPLYLRVIKAIFYDTRKDVIDCIFEKISKIDDKNVILKRNDLAVNGNDLLELGFPRGKAISFALDELMNLVIENPVLNTKENLIQYLKKSGIESYVKNEPFFKLKENAIQRLKSEIVLNDRLINEAKILDKDIEKMSI